jgi:hypothetical protein
MATGETLELNEALKAAFASDLRQLSSARNVSLSDVQIETAFQQFMAENAELIARHGEESVALVTIPNRQKMTTVPPSDRIKGWQTLESGDRKVHTNGFLVDFSGAEPHQMDWEAQKAAKSSLSLAQVDNVYNAQTWINAQVGFDARIAIPDELRTASTLNDGYLAFTVPDVEHALLVNEDYLAYFGSKVNAPIFQINTSQSMMRVLDSDSNAVGFISLSKHPKLLTAAAALETLTHSKLAAFESIVERSFEQEARDAVAHIESTEAAAQLEEHADVQLDVEPRAEPEEEGVAEPNDWRTVVGQPEPESAVEGSLGGFTPAPVFAGAGRKVAADEKLADVLARAAAGEAAARAADPAGAPAAAVDFSGDNDELPEDYARDAENPASEAKAAPAHAAVETSAAGPASGVDVAANVDATAEQAAPAAPEAVPGIAASDLKTQEKVQIPVLAADMLEQAQAAAKLPLGASVSPGADGPEFELGQPIAATYAPAHHYRDMLEKRLATAVSVDHAAAMIRQECESLGHSQEVARQQAQYFRDTLSELSHERDVDALAFCLGRLFNRAFHVWGKPVDERRNFRGQVDKTLEQLDMSLSVEKAKAADPTAPLINGVQASATAAQGGSVGMFQRNRALTGLSDLEHSIDPSGTLDAKPTEASAPMAATLSPEDKYKADVPYMATRATAMFKAMQPEHLINDEQKLDQRWIDKVTEKIEILKGKLSNSSISDVIKNGIQAVLENLGTIFTNLVDMAKKLLSGSKENDQAKDTGKSLDGGRIEPSFTGLER